ncbi:hypothetical protein J4E91_001487 [Alternaria rosae]|nr:hypothetical protein J4E91_001487 [Alternaria rosae]
MSAVFDKMDDGEKWAASKKKFQNGVSDNERKSTVDEDKMADVQTTKGSPRSQDAAADHVGNGTDIGDKDIDKEVPKQPEDSTSSDQIEATSNTAMPFRKRKSAVKGDEGRKKSRKNDEKERVFVGKKDDPPTRDEKKAAAEPVVIPSESKLPPTTKK